MTGAHAAREAVVEAASYAADKAVVALWVFGNRSQPDEEWWHGIAGFATVDQFGAALSARPGRLVACCKLALGHPRLERSEIEALTGLIELSDAINLQSKPTVSGTSPGKRS
jgi:hypothetical protein